MIRSRATEEYEDWVTIQYLDPAFGNKDSNSVFAVAVVTAVVLIGLVLMLFNLPGF